MQIDPSLSYLSIILKEQSIKKCIKPKRITWVSYSSPDAVTHIFSGMLITGVLPLFATGPDPSL